MIRPRPSSLVLALALVAAFGLARAEGEPAPAASTPAAPASSPATGEHGAYTKLHEQQREQRTADHSKFKELEGPFGESDGPAVTKACLTCHQNAAKQVMATSHWTWRVPGAGNEGYGKATQLVNNFCISAIGGNTPACARCHAGYGYENKDFDFEKAENVDCLVCHDTTGDYEKIERGLPNPAIPLEEIAQKVGRPNLKNCGVCHFFGGGGDATKHGDLDNTIPKAPREEDVHMSKDGAGMYCTDCHTTQNHQIGGPNYVIPADRREEPKYAGEAMSRMSCAACHTDAPHDSYILNRHYQKVACQTCHIPEYARGEIASNLWWDWSTAGRLRDGRPYKEEDENGFEKYNSIHGEMIWERNVRPKYIWYNGNLSFTRLTDTLPATRPIVLNPAHGSYEDVEAKIWPFKYHEGKQPYDTVQNKLVAPFTAGPPGSGAYWGDWNWDVAITKGMQTAGLPYSGKYGFVETTMLWPVTHMVAPKEKALACADCHDRKGRLADVGGFYMIGRDGASWLDIVGFTVIGMTIVGVGTHGALRRFMPRLQSKKSAKKPAAKSADKATDKQADTSASRKED